MDVIARSETTKQSPGFGRFEIAASAFGLLAMTSSQISLDGVVACPELGRRIEESIRIVLRSGSGFPRISMMINQLFLCLSRFLMEEELPPVVRR